MITAWGVGGAQRREAFSSKRGEGTTGDAADTVHFPRICFAFNCKLLAQFQVLA